MSAAHLLLLFDSFRNLCPIVWDCLVIDHGVFVFPFATIIEIQIRNVYSFTTYVRPVRCGSTMYIFAYVTNVLHIGRMRKKYETTFLNKLQVTSICHHEFFSQIISRNCFKKKTYKKNTNLYYTTFSVCCDIETATLAKRKTY